MAARDFAGFLGPTGGHPLHRTWNQEYTQNLIMRMLRPPTRGNPGQWALHGTPGHTQFATSGRSDPLDIWAKNGRMFAADRRQAYEVQPNGTMTVLGAVAGDDSPARFDTNGELASQVFINTGGNGYVYDLGTGVFATVTDPEFPTGARGAQYVDGYFIVSKDGTLLFAVSDLFQGLSWSAFDQGRKSSTSDRLQAHLVVGTLLWLMGEWTTEIWYNSGDTSFPYTPIDNVIIDVGLAAKSSLYNIAGLCCLGQTKDGGVSVYEAVGYDLQPWSTPEVDDQLSKILENGGRVDDAIGWGYQVGQESYYVLYLPAADLTLVGNRRTKLWHRWSLYDAVNGVDMAAVGRSHANVWGKHYVSDRRTGLIHEMKGLDDAGTLIRRVRRTPHVSSLDELIIYNNFRLQIQTGEAPLTGNAEDVEPYAGLRLSDNAGKTWGDVITQPIGAIGEYDLIVDFPALGSSRKGKGFELTIVSRQFVGIAGATLDLERG